MKTRGDASLELYKLWKRLSDGEIEAAIHLRELAKQIEEYLDPGSAMELLSRVGDQDKAAKVSKIVTELRHRSESWPVSIPAIPELRKMVVSEFESWGVGSKLPLKTSVKGKGRSREFSGDTTTGFTYYFFREVNDYREWFISSRAIREEIAKSDMPDGLKEAYTQRDQWEKLAVKLPPLTNDHKVVAKWVEATLERIRDQAGGDIESAKFPEFIHRRAEGGDRKGTKNAPIEKAVREVLERGYESLISDSAT